MYKKNILAKVLNKLSLNREDDDTIWIVYDPATSSVTWQDNVPKTRTLDDTIELETSTWMDHISNWFKEPFGNKYKEHIEETLIEQLKKHLKEYFKKNNNKVSEEDYYNEFRDLEKQFEKHYLYLDRKVEMFITDTINDFNNSLRFV